MKAGEKLIPLEDWVLSNTKEYRWFESEDFRNMIDKYAELLTSQPKIEHFIPCKDGKPLGKPRSLQCASEAGDYAEISTEIEAYQEAESKVLWKGWEYSRISTNGEYFIIDHKEGVLHFKRDGVLYSGEKYGVFCRIRNLTFKRDL